MTRLALGFSLLLCSALGLAAGCGGSTATDGSGGAPSGGGSGGTATGGSGNASGGSGNVSGTSGSGGGGTSGSAGTGGSAGTAGTAGTSACSDKGTCTLLPANCCGYCDPNAPLSGYLAVNEKHAASVMEGLCADPVACPDCITQDEPNYLALCRAGQCTPVDLRDDELSACTKDEDCRLRWGSDCCESCGAGSMDDLIVYNKNVNLEAEVCAPFGGACPPCAPPPYPSHILPYCDGHCRWTLVGP